jgi:hypothetical protein
MPVDEPPALLDALRALLEPLARLAVARGLHHATVDEMLRSAFVRAAHAVHTDLPEHRRVSRISAATGIGRREVARVMATVTAAASTPQRSRSVVSELFAHWTADPQYRDKRGRPRRLPRLGPAPSFEALARSVTRDVHPRSLLEEMVRLELARQCPDDGVELVRETNVPRGDRARMDAFLGANVGDHLSAAADNVLADGHEHFEQAIFAEGLSQGSIQLLRGLIAAHWHALTAELVPKLEKMIKDDAKANAGATHRVRVGLFSYQAEVEPCAATAGRTRQRRTSKAASRSRRAAGEK